MEDRIEEIIAAIVQSIFTSPDSHDLEHQLVAELAKQGYEAADIQEAFQRLGEVLKTLRTAAPKHHDGSKIKSVPTRSLSDFESLRMSDEAIYLFRTWQELKLMTNEETEDILQEVILSNVGDIDSQDLLRIAEGCASRGSSLQLYLAGPTGPLQ